MNLQMSVTNVIFIFPKLAYYVINLGLVNYLIKVYFLEYTILSGFADRAHSRETTGV